MEDYAKEDRRALIAPTPDQIRERKLKIALAHLGTRYVCHKSNSVKRLEKPLGFIERTGRDLV